MAWTESFDGTNGTDVTTSSTTLDFVSSTAPTFDTGQFIEGTSSMRCTASGASVYGYKNITSGSNRWLEFFFRLNALPSATLQLSNVLASATNKAQIRVLTDGTVQLRDNFSSVWSSTGTLSAGTWYRAAWHFDGAGHQTLSIYVGNGSSAWASSGSQTYSGGSFDRWQLGCTTSTTADVWVDAASDAATERGPLVTAPTVDAGTDVTIQDYHSTALDSTASGTYSAAAWSVASGPSTSSSQFSSTTDDDPTFTPAGGPGAYTLRRTLTYTGGTVSDDVTVTVTALQASDGVASVTTSTGWTASSGTVADVLTGQVDGGYITSSDNPTSLDLKFVMRGIIPPSGDYTLTLPLGRSGGTGTVDVSLYDTDGSTLIKKISGTTAPTTFADTDIVFAAADITALTDSDWRAGVVILVEATAS